jgi:hypothetical protein
LNYRHIIIKITVVLGDNVYKTKFSKRAKKLSIKRIIDRIINLPRLIIGVAIVKLPFLKRYKTHLLSTWMDSDKRSKVDNFLFEKFFSAWIRLEYLKEADADKREELKNLAMNTNAVLNWANNCQTLIDLNEKVGSMTRKEVKKYTSELDTILNTTEANYTVIQIGCASGKEVAYLANRFPNHKFIGTDIFDNGVKYASQYHVQPNLTFIVSPAKDIGSLLKELKIHSTDTQVIVYSSGSAQYIQPDHLTVFFDSLSKYPNARVLINDTAIDESKIKLDELEGSTWRGNFAFSHNYKWYAEKADFKTVKCELIRPYCPPEDYPPDRRNEVHYYYYGKIN